MIKSRVVGYVFLLEVLHSQVVEVLHYVSQKFQQITFFIIENVIIEKAENALAVLHIFCWRPAKKIKNIS